MTIGFCFKDIYYKYHIPMNIYNGILLITNFEYFVDLGKMNNLRIFYSISYEIHNKKENKKKDWW